MSDFQFVGSKQIACGSYGCVYATPVAGSGYTHSALVHYAMPDKGKIQELSTPGEIFVYKFGLKDGVISDEIEACRLVKIAFTRSKMQFQDYTPLVDTALVKFKWNKVSQAGPGPGTEVKCIPLRRYEEDGMVLFDRSLKEEGGSFKATIIRILYAFMCFLDVVHSTSMLHMDCNLSNSLFNRQKTQTSLDGCVSDFGCMTSPDLKPYDVGNKFGGNAWLTPLLSQPQAADAAYMAISKNMWEQYAPNMYTEWCKTYTDFKRDLVKAHVPYIDFHTLAYSFMESLDFEDRHTTPHNPHQEENRKLTISVITCLVGNPNHAPLNASTMFAALLLLINPSEVPGYVSKHRWVDTCHPITTYVYPRAATLTAALTPSTLVPAAAKSSQNATSDNSSCHPMILTIFEKVADLVNDKAPEFFAVKFVPGAAAPDGTAHAAVLDIRSKVENSDPILISSRDLPCLTEGLSEIFVIYVVAQLLKLAQAKSAAECEKLVPSLKKIIMAKLEMLTAMSKNMRTLRSRAS